MKLSLKMVLIGLFSVSIYLLRFYNFPGNPPALNWDEVSIGYNAYSILKTGRDEFGNRFPLLFRSLDDYKQPIYIYATALMMRIIGYNDVAVRITSALAGMGSILILYLLIKYLTENTALAICSAFIFSVLPWNIQFSRMGSEANTALFVVLTGTYLFIKGINKKSWLLPLSILIIGLSAYTYLSFRVFAVLLYLLLVFIYRKKFLIINVYSGLSLLISLAFGFLLINEIIGQGVHIRFTGTNVFTHNYDIYKQNETEMFHDAVLGINIPRRIFHDNKYLVSAGLIISGYLSHFSPDFLFFGYNQKHHHTPFTGLIYVWMLPLILVGAYFFIKKAKPKYIFLIFGWLVISPVAASATWDIPHAIRVIPLTIPFSIFIAYGLTNVFDILKNYKITKIIFSFTSIGLLMFSLFHYFHQYQIHLPNERSADWQYTRREMTQYLENVKYKYNKIIVSTKLEWPYIFMLYYSKYDPVNYLSQGGTMSGGWGEQGNKYDNFEFHEFNYSDFQTDKSVLFVGKPEEFIFPTVNLNQSQKYSNIKKIIYSLNKVPEIYFVDNSLQQ